jgi:hypothetical protein
MAAVRPAARLKHPTAWPLRDDRADARMPSGGRMQHASLTALVFALCVIPGAPAAQQMPASAGQTYSLSAEMLAGYRMTQTNLAEAAEKMPDEHWEFRPTPDIKPFGQLVAHAALAQFRNCATLKGEDNPKKDEKEEARRSRADAVALLKASAGYCDPPMSALSDTAMSELTKMGPNQVAKGLFPAMVITHGAEMYGTMAVYLRLKGIVPPTTEKANQMKAKQ